MRQILDNIIEAHNRFARSYKEVATDISDVRADLRPLLLAVGATFSTLKFSLEETELERNRYAEALFQLGRLYSGLRLVQRECVRGDDADRTIVRGDAFQWLFSEIEEMKAGWTRLLVDREI